MISTQRIAILRRRLLDDKPIPAYDAPLAAKIDAYLDTVDCTCEHDDWNCWYRRSGDQQVADIAAAVT